jgi:hypothetical protein
MRTLWRLNGNARQYYVYIGFGTNRLVRIIAREENVSLLKCVLWLGLSA